MMFQLLFPRLSNLGAEQLLAERAFEPSSPDLLTGSAPAFISWAATGGRRISADELKRLRKSILEIAAASGFPESNSQLQRASFDQKCATFLIEQSNIPTGEGLRDDVWAYLTVVLVRDVCIWRFPGPPKERILGGVRNTLQRLWLRGLAFDRGAGHSSRWEFLSILSEDAMVQVTERPSVAANRPLARAIAECWLETSKRIGRSNMENVMRAAVRNIRISNEVILFAALKEEEIRASVREHFQKAARSGA